MFSLFTHLSSFFIFLFQGNDHYILTFFKRFLYFRSTFLYFTEAYIIAEELCYLNFSYLFRCIFSSNGFLYAYRQVHANESSVSTAEVDVNLFLLVFLLACTLNN